ncbi:MAG: hypothetical protein M3007_03980 [Candidatus Eremiobacteraeota bacterium]|nr:hypothetical protein [Candidatus Eremiobacteraeota bacterium]
MSLETLTSIATIGTFVILTASAIAAIVQLQHLRAQNQLTGLLNVLERVEDSRFNEWVDAARDELNANIENPEFRLEVERGVMQRKDNPWLNLGNSYDWVGSLVKHKLIPADAVMDVYSLRILRAWEIMRDVVAISRRQDGPGVWENFEYLAVLAKQWASKKAQGAYPKNFPRMPLPDRWLEADKKFLRDRTP